jgi:hypothetical protein
MMLQPRSLCIYFCTCTLDAEWGIFRDRYLGLVTVISDWRQLRVVSHEAAFCNIYIGGSRQ